MKKLFFLTFLLVSTLGLSSSFAQVSAYDYGHGSTDNLKVAEFGYTINGNGLQTHFLNANPSLRGSNVTVEYSILSVFVEEIGNGQNNMYLIDLTGPDTYLTETIDEVNVNNYGLTIYLWEVKYSDGATETKQIYFY